MTYGKITELGTRKADQCRTGIENEEKIFRRSDCDTSGRIRDLPASGLSVCARSGKDRKRSSYSGYKDCLHGEAFHEFDRGASKVCKEHRGKPERNSNASSGILTEKRSEAWVTGGNAIDRSKRNTSMTDCQRTRSCKFIGSWFLKRPVYRAMQMVV